MLSHLLRLFIGQRSCPLQSWSNSKALKIIGGGADICIPEHLWVWGTALEKRLDILVPGGSRLMFTTSCVLLNTSVKWTLDICFVEITFLGGDTLLYSYPNTYILNLSHLNARGGGDQYYISKVTPNSLINNNLK